MRVVIDNRELKSRVQVARNGFELEDCECVVGRLEYGDYLFEYFIVWEYKTVTDFVSSMWDGSLFNEIYNQSTHYPFSFLIIEGDFNSFFYKQYFRSGKSKSGKYFNVKEYINSQMNMVNGAIRRCRTVCNVINFKTQAECLNEMLEQSRKCEDFKVYGGVVRPLKEYNVNPCKAPLMDIKGVGDKISDKIIDEFGLKCLNDLMSICYDELLGVSGVNKDMCDNFWLKVYGYVPDKNKGES